MFTNRYVCPGDLVTYECTIKKTGSTVWAGDAFNCSGTDNEIVLLHSRFHNEINGSCNNGAIVARSLSVEGENYTSQLNVTVTPDTAGKTVECNSDNGTNTILISSFSIPTTGLSL